jgi:acetyl esterase/lipase
MKGFRPGVFLFLYACIACLTACQTLPDGFDEKKLGTVERDIKYCTMDHVDLKLDVYYPHTRETQWPVVIYIHAGGWVAGAKDLDSFGLVDIEAMQESGFLLVSVEYRLAPKYKFPAMIEDVKCAVRFLRAHADEYNLDPERFGAMGGSAGGHLASLLGVTDTTAGFDVGEYLDYSSRVQAVVSMYGPADLAPPFTRRLWFSRMDVFGTADVNDPIFVRASPVNYATPDDPPFLLFQGEFDTTVPPEQAGTLLRHLQRGGVEVELIMVENAGHGLLAVDEKPIVPSLEEIRKQTLLFWQVNLK